MYKLAFAAILVGALFAGCNPAKLSQSDEGEVLVQTSRKAPTLEQAKEALSAYVTKVTGGRVSILAVKKTDGQNIAPMGVACYIFSYEATVRANEELRLGAKGEALDESPFGTNVTVPKGAEYGIHGEIEFELKESGWVKHHIDVERSPNAVIDATIPPPAKPRDLLSRTSQ